MGLAAAVKQVIWDVHVKTPRIGCKILGLKDWNWTISTLGFGREKPWLSFPPPERLGPGQRRALRCGAVSMDLQAACEVEMGMAWGQPWLPYRTAMTGHVWIFSPIKMVTWGMVTMTARVYHMIYCCVFKQWHSSWINKLGLDGSFGQWALEHHHCSYKWVVFHGDVKLPEGRVVVDDLLYLYTIKTYSFWYGDGNPWMQFCPQNCQTLAEWQGGSRMNLHGYCSRFWVLWSSYSHKHDVNIAHGTMGLHGTWCRNLFPSDEILPYTVYTYLVPMKYGSQYSLNGKYGKVRIG